MLNAAVGSEVETHGKTCILTRLGAAGDAVYGPYETLPPGYYAVEFNLGAAERHNFDRDEHPDDETCSGSRPAIRV